MACVAGTYSIHPHFRPNEAIADTFFRPTVHKTAKEKDPRRPEPLFRRTIASLRDKKPEVFRRSTQSAKSRIHAGTEEKLALMDGEIALKNRSREFLPDWPEALDITHAVTRLRIAGQLHYGAGHTADEYGREGLLLLLEGKVDHVIEDWEISFGRGSAFQQEGRGAEEGAGLLPEQSGQDGLRSTPGKGSSHSLRSHREHLQFPHKHTYGRAWHVLVGGRG